MPVYEYSSSGEDGLPDEHYQSGSAGDDCDRYTLSLTALFDGEATAEEEIAARLHLARCLRCAEMWRSWSQTRGIWRATPAVRVPAGLLLRILMACRLAALRKTPSAGKSRIAGETRSPLSTVIDVPPVPSHLREAILQRTVAASTTGSREESLQPVADSRRFALLSNVSMQQRRTWPQRPTRLSLSHWATAVAVPAGLMWMVAVSDRWPEDAPATVVSSKSTLTVRRDNDASGANPARDRKTMSDERHARKASPSAGREVSVRVLSPDARPDLAERNAIGDEEADASSVREKGVATRAFVPTPRNQWPAAEFSASASTRSERVWSDIPDSLERVSFKPSTPGNRSGVRASQAMLSVKSQAKPRIAPAVWSVTPGVSQPARGRGVARVTLRRSENSSREVLLRASTRAMQSRLRVSNPLSSLPTRETSKLRVDDSGAAPEASFVGDFSENDETHRSSANDPDNLRNIVNEYRSTLLDEDETTGASTASSASSNGTL